MKTRTFWAIAALGLSIVAPVVTQAQVPPPVAAPPGYQQACRPQVTPSEQQLMSRFMRHFSQLGLTQNQEQRIQSMVDQFSRTHPAGSPLDVAAMRQLRYAVRSVLTPQQMAILEQERQQRRATHPPMQHRCP